MGVERATPAANNSLFFFFLLFLSHKAVFSFTLHYFYSLRGRQVEFDAADVATRCSSGEPG